MTDAPFPSPLRVVGAAAPIRICDIGGWTDTWFARHGHVFNIAVAPLVEVQVEVFPEQHGTPSVAIRAMTDRDTEPAARGTHPLLEAAIASMPVPDGVRIEVRVSSVVPPAAGTGTSAAVAVAVIAALDLLTPGRLTPTEIARAAHDVEVHRLRQQCGVQDQLASALGGISFIDIVDYPEALVTQLEISDTLASALGQRLSLVFLGRAHDSSVLHERVIRRLAGSGPDCSELDDLRQCAVLAKRALGNGDLAALGRAMIANTDAQARLHADLVGADAREVIAIARAHGALGWKVNGAGGDGGSVTLLGSHSPSARRAMLTAIAAANPLFCDIPIQLSPAGVKRWDSLSAP